MENNYKKVEVSPPFIKLGDFLKFSGAVRSGGDAKDFINTGMVKVNGTVCKMRGKKLAEGDLVEVLRNNYEVAFTVNSE